MIIRIENVRIDTSSLTDEIRCTHIPTGVTVCCKPLRFGCTPFGEKNRISISDYRHQLLVLLDKKVKEHYEKERLYR